MKSKKNPNADLEKRRVLFLQIGLIGALAIVWISLEWKSYETNIMNMGSLTMDNTEEEIIPITERELTPPPPPPPMEELLIVEDEKEIEEELEVKDMEISQITEITAPKEIEEIEENRIFIIVEDMPKFGKGESDLLNYLAQNIKYPQMAKESGISGIVYVTFVVGKDGKVKDVNVLRGIGGGCDKEAIRVVSGMPDWVPGRQRGKPVSVQYNLPVRFVLR